MCTITPMLTTTTADGLTTGEHGCTRAAAATGTAAVGSPDAGDSGATPANAAKVEGARTQRPGGSRYEPAFGIEQDSGADGDAVLHWLETGEGQPWRPNRMREHLRALALYRGMYRDHGWACSVLEALLRTAGVVIRSARTCRCCRGTGLGCSWPPVGCSVCMGLGIEIQEERRTAL